MRMAAGEWGGAAWRRRVPHMTCDAKAPPPPPLPRRSLPAADPPPCCLPPCCLPPCCLPPCCLSLPVPPSPACRAWNSSKVSSGMATGSPPLSSTYVLPGNSAL